MFLLCEKKNLEAFSKSAYDINNTQCELEVQTSSVSSIIESVRGWIGPEATMLQSQQKNNPFDQVKIKRSDL